MNRKDEGDKEMLVKRKREGERERGLTVKGDGD